MNSLNMDLGGGTVILREEYDRYWDRENPVNGWRILAVPITQAGEGAIPNGLSSLLYGYWLSNQWVRVIVDARDVERWATRKDLALLPTPPQCYTCVGSGEIAGFRCVTCGGTGAYTPIMPLADY